MFSRSRIVLQRSLKSKFSTITATSNEVMTVIGNLPVTNECNIVDPLVGAKFPMYRVTETDGSVVEGAILPDFDKETAQNMYTVMGRIQALDDVFYNAQRQGRISFYMQSSGEEAIHVGTASALKAQDTILAQYREVGVLLWRGFTVQQCADQCFSNEMDLGKGKQMPVHYGSKELNFQTISSPLTTQLPQAAGVAYAHKLAKDDAVAVVYFGEGAASEGDFHAGMNFAATLEAPCVFICRNNGYAISTPIKDQYRGDGIISRAAGYGMYSIRVDGNDLMAVHQATAKAREYALTHSRPVFLELMTYRRGHHSTSDDSTRYREVSEIEYWHDNQNCMKRFRGYMESKEWWDEELEVSMRESERKAVLTALETAEKRPKPPMSAMFEDVYAEIPTHLKQQQDELNAHIAKYPDHYANLGH